jgi:hypothetical protein
VLSFSFIHKNHQDDPFFFRLFHRTTRPPTFSLPLKPDETCHDGCRSASMGHFDQCTIVEEKVSPQTYTARKKTGMSTFYRHLIPRIVKEIAASHQKHKIGSEYVSVKVLKYSKRANEFWWNNQTEDNNLFYDSSKQFIFMYLSLFHPTAHS